MVTNHIWIANSSKNGNWSKIEQRVLIPKIIHKSVKVIHSLLGNEEDDENDEKESSTRL